LAPLIRDTRVGSQSPNKRKRNTEEDDQIDPQDIGDAEVEADDEDDADGVDDGDDEPDTRPTKRKGKATEPRKAKAKAKGPPPPKKPRMAKNALPKPQKTPKPTKRKARANGDFDADKLATETKISADNPLFSAYELITLYLPYPCLFCRCYHEPVRSAAIHCRGLSGFIGPESWCCSGRTYQLYSTGMRVQ
jgi:hypothetical protein